MHVVAEDAAGFRVSEVIVYKLQNRVINATTPIRSQPDIGKH